MRIYLALTLWLVVSSAWAGDYLCRVLIFPDGTVQVVHPSQTDRKPGESDQDVLNRQMAVTYSVIPSLQSLPYIDVPFSAIPKDKSKMAAWRVQGGKVVIDATVVIPKTKAQLRADACAKIKSSSSIDQLVKDLCASF